LGQARMWNLDGIAHYAMADMSSAFKSFQRELEIYEQLGFEANLASAHSNLAEIAMQLGDDHSAAAHQQASLDLALRIGQPVMLAYSSLIAARLAAGLEDWSLAVVLQASAESELAAASHTLYDNDRKLLEDLHEQAVQTLGAVAVADKTAGADLGAVAAATVASSVFSDVLSRTDDPTKLGSRTEGNPS